ncbi:hypothetical protein CJ235_03405 [Staphylococcus pettenkoferi]|uniref:ATPase AAA-type core domain-containing protein n=1 Tax=Staphylococcus pettenkoferi TaxID=170573 RepID=A0A2N6QM23_9STAP|nr:AAA family ATPase [Staphylococcus pettenkoferi]PMC20737.1 hypothetical protein CJ235_03405 [Staphylococcus pettenkoferi]
MIKRIYLENYKSFKHIDVDFLSPKKSNNINLIYGENGSGKSNIISVFSFIVHLQDTIISNERLLQFIDEMGVEVDPRRLLKHLPFSKITNTIELMDSENIAYRGNNENTKIVLELLINNRVAEYSLVLNASQGVIEEKLFYLIEKKRGTLYHFKIDEKGEPLIRLSPHLLKDGEAKQLIVSEIKKYWGKHTFLAITKYAMLSHHTNSSYINRAINNNMKLVLNEIDNLSVDYKGNEFRIIRGESLNQIQTHRLEYGQIKHNQFNEKNFKLTEHILNYIFTSLYTDINKVYYQFKELENTEIEYELYVVKKLYGELVPIPFKIESAGTTHLLHLVPMIISLAQGKTVVVDEIDYEIHDLLMKALIESILDIKCGQLIATTHNTMLLQNIDKKNVYIIDLDSEANKQVINLGAISKRIQPNHSIYSQYLQGHFGGVPFIDDIDLEYIQELIEEGEYNLDEK